MKTTNIPSDYDKAIKAGRVEYATQEGSSSRAHLVQFVNLIKGLELRGVSIPTNQSFDYEALLREAESRGINIPSTPFSKLSVKEQRSFSDTLTGIKIPSVTDNLTPRQRELYEEHLHYKNNDKRDFHGNWIKAKS